MSNPPVDSAAQAQAEETAELHRLVRRIANEMVIIHDPYSDTIELMVRGAYDYEVFYPAMVLCIEEQLDPIDRFEMRTDTFAKRVGRWVYNFDSEICELHDANPGRGAFTYTTMTVRQLR